MPNNIINRVKAKQASFNMPLNQEVTMNADGSGGPISINKQTPNTPYLGRSWYDSFSDWGHMALDGLGMVPGIGAVADLANAGWYGAEGAAQNLGLLDDEGAGEGWKGNLGMSLGAAIPGAGQGITAAKYAYKAGKAGKNMKLLENVKKGWQGMSKTGKFFNFAFPAVSLVDNIDTKLKEEKSKSEGSVEEENYNLENKGENQKQPENINYQNNQRPSNRSKSFGQAWIDANRKKFNK